MVAFRKRREPMNWKMIAAGREVEELMRDPDTGISEIQTQLNTVCYGNLRDGVDQEKLLLLKALGYGQLTIEYLLHVQDSLAAACQKSKEEADDWRAQAEELARKEKKSRGAAKRLRECQTTLQAASHMLTQFGVDTEPLRRMCEDTRGGSGGARAPEYVWVPAYLDPYDGKAFQSAEYLKRHMFGKHALDVKADLLSGRFFTNGTTLSGGVGFGSAEEFEGMVNTMMSSGRGGGGGGGRGGGHGTTKGAEQQQQEDSERTTPLPAPRDAIEAAARWVVEEVGSGGASAEAGGTVSRKKLLKALQYLKTHPAECEAYRFPEPHNPDSGSSSSSSSATVHDLLASKLCVDASSEMNASCLLDWKGVDAHLRVYNEVDTFLRSDLEQAMAAKLSAKGAEVAKGFEMKALENLDDKAMRLFNEIDNDNSGDITLQELMDAVKHPVKGKAIRASLGFGGGSGDEEDGEGGGGALSKQEVEQALEFIERKMNELDSNGDGLVDLGELKGFMERTTFFNHGFKLGKQVGFGAGSEAGQAGAEVRLGKQLEAKDADAALLAGERDSLLKEKGALVARVEEQEIQLTEQQQQSLAAGAAPPPPARLEKRGASGRNTNSSTANDDDGDSNDGADGGGGAESLLTSMPGEAARLFLALDTDRSGFVTCSEFVEGVMNANDSTRAALGFVNFVKLTHSEKGLSSSSSAAAAAASQQQQPLTRQEVKRRFECGVLDEDGDGVVTFEELAKFVVKFKAFNKGYAAGQHDGASNNNGDQQGAAAAAAFAKVEEEVEAALKRERKEAKEKAARLAASKEKENQQEGALVVPATAAESVVVEASSNLEPLPEPEGSDLFFELYVLSASNLRAMDRNGLSDPLAIVKVNGKKVCETKTVGKTLWPRWTAAGAGGAHQGPSSACMVKISGADLAKGWDGAVAAQGKKAAKESSNGTSGSSRFEVAIELWDVDNGFISHKRTDFLGSVILTRRELFDPKHLGAGPIRFPLRPAPTAKHGGFDVSTTATTGNGRQHSGGSSSVVASAHPPITGSLEVVWHAKAAVRVGIVKAENLRSVEKKSGGGLLGVVMGAGSGGSFKTHAPSAKVVLGVPGCEILDGKGERRKVSSHSFQTAACGIGNNPEWGEDKCLVVPLDRPFDGARFEVVDKPTGQVLGVAVLSPDELLVPSLSTTTSSSLEKRDGSENKRSSSSSGGGGAVFKLLSPDDPACALGVEGGTSSAEAAAHHHHHQGGGGQQIGESLRTQGTLTLTIDAPPGIAEFAAAARRNRMENASKGPAASPLEFMEVEVACLKAGGLASPKEPFVRLKLDGEYVGKRSKAKATTRFPVWGAKDRNSFIVAIPFPKELAALASASASSSSLNYSEGEARTAATTAATRCPMPSTVVTVELWDENKITRNELLGQVKLTWNQLVHPSLKAHNLTSDYNSNDDGIGSSSSSSIGGAGVEKSGDGGSGKEKAKGRSSSSSSKKKHSKVKAGAQGTLTLRVRQLQAFEVTVVGAYGLATADHGRNSDPFVELSLRQFHVTADNDGHEEGGDKTHSGGGGGGNDAAVAAAATAAAAAVVTAADAPEEDGLGEGGSKLPPFLRTEWRTRTLAPLYYHHFMFSRALDPTDRSCDKAERKRRREFLKSHVSSYSSTASSSASSSSVSEESLLFPGTWAETTGAGSTSSCAYTDFFPFAVRGDRLLSADSNHNEGSSKTSSSSSTGGGCGGGGGGNGALRKTLKGLSLELSLFDRDEFSAPDFLGKAVLSESQLRSPRKGVVSLRLQHDTHRNRSKLKVSGWVEVIVRASVAPEVCESSLFRARFPLPSPEIVPVIGVRLSGLRAQGLIAADTNGFSDPYARVSGSGVLVPEGGSSSGRGDDVQALVLKDGHAMGSTEVVTRSLSPKWQGVFELLLPLDVPTTRRRRTTTSGRGLYDEEEEEEEASLALLSDDEDSSFALSSTTTGSGGGVAGALSSSSAAAANLAETEVEFALYDKDTLGKDDFLGRCRLNFAELTTLAPLGIEGKKMMPSAEDEALDAAAAASGKQANKKRRSFEFFSCRYIDILPPTGSMHLEVAPLVLLDLTLIGAFGLNAANFDGKSDPYIRVHVVGGGGGGGGSGGGDENGGGGGGTGLLCPHASAKDGYLRDFEVADGGYTNDSRGGGGKKGGVGGKRPYRSSVKTGTLNPTWYETVTVPLDLRCLFGRGGSGGSGGDDNGGGGDEDLKTKAIRSSSSSGGADSGHECGLSLEVWDEPSVAGHKFLGRVLLDRPTLAHLVLAPSPVPLQLSLTDAPDGQVPRSKKLGSGKLPVKGTLELHARASYLPDPIKDALAGRGAAERATVAAAQPGGFSIGAAAAAATTSNPSEGLLSLLASPRGNTNDDSTSSMRLLGDMPLFPSSSSLGFEREAGGLGLGGGGGGGDDDYSHLRSSKLSPADGKRGGEVFSHAFEEDIFSFASGGRSGGGGGGKSGGLLGSGEALAPAEDEEERKLGLLLRETALQNRAARRQKQEQEENDSRASPVRQTPARQGATGSEVK